MFLRTYVRNYPILNSLCSRLLDRWFYWYHKRSDLASILHSWGVETGLTESLITSPDILCFGILDTVLAGYVISKSQAPSRMDCAFDCLSDQRCGSYNYEEGDKVLHVCELNSECKESKPSNLTGKAGYSYYGTGRNVRNRDVLFS